MCVRGVPLPPDPTVRPKLRRAEDIAADELRDPEVRREYELQAAEHHAELKASLLGGWMFVPGFRNVVWRDEPDGSRTMVSGHIVEISLVPPGSPPFKDHGLIGNDAADSA